MRLMCSPGCAICQLPDIQSWKHIDYGLNFCTWTGYYFDLILITNKQTRFYSYFASDPHLIIAMTAKQFHPYIYFVSDLHLIIATTAMISGNSFLDQLCEKKPT
jgi:hypothetical protein